MTCGDLKEHYKTEECCGSPDKEMSQSPGAAACPYSFAKPACEDAEPQAPRDLTDGASGEMTPKAATLTETQAMHMPLTNVHFHLGAEHKSQDYSDGTASDTYDAANSARRLAEGEVRPGWMCATSDLTSDQMAEYTFEYCKGDVAVGKTYEVHYVHSSAGYSEADLVDADYDGIEDGLGGAANGRGLLNPMVVVQGLVFQIVNGAEAQDELLNNTWTALVDKANSVMYAGSTTGPSHNDEVCSPYSVTWHVDKTCHRIPPESFDNLCMQMKQNYNLELDLYPHGSRKIVDSKYVVEGQYVTALA